MARVKPIWETREFNTVSNEDAVSGRRAVSDTDYPGMQVYGVGDD